MGTWVHKDNVPDKYSMSRWKWLLKDSVTNERWATIQSWDDFLDWDDLTDEEYDLFSDLFMKTVLVEEIDAADFVPGYGIFKIKDNKRHTGYALILVTGYAFSGIEYNLDGIFCSIKAVQDYMSKGGMWN
jgi:hypothetical protein